MGIISVLVLTLAACSPMAPGEGDTGWLGEATVEDDTRDDRPGNSGGGSPTDDDTGGISPSEHDAEEDLGECLFEWRDMVVSLGDRNEFCIDYMQNDPEDWLFQGCWQEGWYYRDPNLDSYNIPGNMSAEGMLWTDCLCEAQGIGSDEDCDLTEITGLDECGGNFVLHYTTPPECP